MEKSAKYSYDEALQLLMKQCSVAEKCSFDIKNKIILWGLSREEAQQITDRLISERFVSNERYARAYIRDKSKFNGWGERKIHQMLRNKDIDSQMITQLFEEVLDRNIEQERCFNILKKKLPTIKHKNQYDLRSKLFAFGAGRGYDFDTLNKHISKLLGELE